MAEIHSYAPACALRRVADNGCFREAAKLISTVDIGAQNSLSKEIGDARF